MTLPAWTTTPEASALLAAIRLEQPECWHLKRNAWDNCRYPRFKGANARAFRNLWEAERTKARDANDGETFRALNEPHPDDIIAALLNEATVPWTPVEMKDLGDGRARFAA